MLRFHSKTIDCILLFTVSLISIVVFSDTFGSPYFVQLYYVLLASFAFFTYKTVHYKFLTRVQIFYIVPLLTLNFLAKDHALSDYLFKLMVFNVSTLICFYEILERSEYFKYSHSTATSLVLGALFAICVYALCTTFARASAFVLSLNMLVLYFLTIKNSNNAPIVSRIQLKQSIAVPLYLTIIVTTYLGLILSTRFHFILYLCYIISVVNLCFCFRRNKTLFVITGTALTLLSIVAVKISEAHIDGLLLAALISLLHVKHPIVYSKKTQHGALRVEYNYKRNSLNFINDNVYHGEKRYDEDAHTMYYGDPTKGPISSVLTLLPNGNNHKLAVLGLGAGVLASFGKKGQQITFYEINPEVVKIARRQGFFDYLANSEAKINIVLGDAREELAKAEDNYYDLLCVDVYSANSVPTHFLTIEAMQLYSRKLKDTGILMLNMACKTDKHLESMIAKIASKLNLFAYSYHQSLVMHEVDPHKAQIPYKIFSFIEKLCKMQLTSFFKQPHLEAYSWAVLSKSELKTPEACINVDTPDAPRWNKLHITQEETVYTDKHIHYKPTLESAN